jgi:hypothetical protein
MRFLKNLSRLLVLTLFAAVSIVTGFNCSAQRAHSVKTNFSSDETSLISKGEDLPYSLLNAEQALASMINVTGLGTSTTNINNEYNIRSSSFAEVSNLSKINAPMLLSATSLAGEVCNALIAKERPLATNARAYFQSVNFAAGPAQIDNASFDNTVLRLTQKFWGRAPSSEEAQMLVDFRNEHIAALTAAERAAVAQTATFYLSLCSSVLSSFDSLTF